MRLLAIHTAPLWQEGDGSRTVGMYYRPHHPPVAGRVNAIHVEIHGEARWLLLVHGEPKDR